MSSKTGVFHLSKAKLHEFPPELVKVVGVLRTIDLSENKIASLPMNIGAFVNLKHLNLNHNSIEIIPDQIATLIKLESLSITFNKIKAVTPAVQKLTKLKDVDLSHNQLPSFPTMFCGLPHLTVLNLANNKIQVLPDGIGGLQVIELIVNQNQINKISDDLAACPKLKTLRLQENCLSIQNFPTKILTDSSISLISTEGNLFDTKEFSELEGYEKYMERYTATKKKLT